MKKRIALFLPGGIGGGLFSQGQPVLMQTVDQLAKQFDITVFSFHPSNSDYQPSHLKFISPESAIKRGMARWYLLILMFLKHHRKNKFQVLYACWGFPSGVLVALLGKVLGLPSIIHLQGGDVVWLPQIKYGSLRNFFSRALARYAYQKADEVIALTQYQAKYLQKMRVNRSVNIIPYGVDLKLFSTKEFCYNSTRELRCLHVANLSAIKDQATLIKTFALVSDSVNAKLRVVGFDTLNGVLKEMVKEVGLQDRVEFYPSQPYHQMNEFYHWADVFILTSLYEGQGIVLAEAAASGVLLAGTSVGLLDDLGSEYGIIANPQEADELANQIIVSLSKPEWLNTKVKNSYSWAKENDLSHTVSKIVEVIKRTIDQSQ